MHDHVADRIEVQFPFCLQMCFLLLFLAFQVWMMHQRPLCIWSLNAQQLTQKRTCAQLLSRIPRHRVIHSSFCCSLLPMV